MLNSERFESSSDQPRTRRLVGRAKLQGRGVWGAVARACGFTFTEVMFAVVILGVGFIMIAAIFPVAIRQGQASAEESVAVTAAQRAITTLASRATSDLFPPTTAALTTNQNFRSGILYFPPYVSLGEAWKSEDGNWTQPAANTNPADYQNSNAQKATETAALKQWYELRGDLISTVDSRLGFAVAYSRGNAFPMRSLGNPASVVQQVAAASSMNVVMIVAQNRNRATFNDEDTSSSQANWLRDLRIPTAAPDPFRVIDKQFISASGAAGTAPATLQLKRLTSQFLIGANGAPDQIRFFTDQLGNMASPRIGSAVASTAWPVATGCFVIVADAANGSPTQIKDGSSTSDTPNARANGRVFRVGKEVPRQRYPTYELVPGQDISSLPATTLPDQRIASSVPPTDPRYIDAPPYFQNDFPADTSSGKVEVLVLGRALQNPLTYFDATRNPYIGPPMDVAVYTATIGVKP